MPQAHKKPIVEIDSRESKHTRTVDIKVHEFSKQSLEDFLFSPTFEVGGKQWRLVIDIGGNDSDDSDYIGCYLQCTSVGSVTASYKLTVIDHDDDDTEDDDESFRKDDETFERDCPLANEEDRSQCKGDEHFVERSVVTDEDDGLLKDDCLLIRVKITCEMTSPCSAEIVKYNLSSLQNDADSADFTITVQGSTISGDFLKTIKTHKLVLSAFSEVFKSMAYGPMKEAHSNTLVIDDFSIAAVETMLDFLYHGELPKTMDMDLALELLSLSCKYQIEILKSRCSKELVKVMSAENAISILSAVDVLSLSELKETTLTFIVDNFTKIGTDYAENLHSIQKHLLTDILQKIALAGVKRERE